MNKQNITYKVLRRLVYIIFHFFDFIIPKNKNIIIFASQSGIRYFDNSQYLYEYFIKNHSSSYEIYWATYSENIKNKLLKSHPNNKILLINKIKSLYLMCRAKTIVYSYSRGDLGGFVFSSNTNIVYLDHGISLKCVGITDKKFTKKKKLNLIKKETSKYSLVIASSPTEKMNLSVSWGIDIDKIKITGYPRNDVLFNNKSTLNIEFSYLNKKVILYAPTFRDNYVTELFPFSDLDLTEINDFLVQENAYLLLRGHATETIFNKNTKTGDFAYKYERILEFNQDKEENVNELLPFVDILISDYSGIYIDFLLLDKPIIFIPYDLELYEKERGLLFNYNAVTPGPKIFTQQNLLKELKLYFNQNSRYKCEREIVRNLFHTYQDANSRKRVAKEILKGLNNNE